MISAIPQDLKFYGEKTTLEIGDHTTVREFATLNRGTEAYGKTVIGSHVLIMAMCMWHMIVFSETILSWSMVSILLGMLNWGNMDSLEACQLFINCKNWSACFHFGGSLVRKDVPPYVKAGRDPVQYQGVNSIGLRRRGFDNPTINHIQDIYRHVFLNGMNTAQALDYVGDSDSCH